MDTSTDHQQPSEDPLPGWVLLENYDRHADTVAEAFASGVRHVADTVTEALSSGGRHVRVSLSFAAPPALSRMRVDCPGGLPEGTQLIEEIIAAHGGSVLVHIHTSRPGWFDTDECDSSDYFVYNAGDAAADPSRPPSLSLLPPCHVGKRRYMTAKSSALLRRSEDDLLVTQLSLHGTKGKPVEMEAELCLLRSGGWEWELKRLPVLYDDAKRHEVSFWETDAVIPVGDRFLCWVDYSRGVVLSDVWKETPQLRYVSLPVEPAMEHRSRLEGHSSSYRRVCATDGGGAVSFVQVSPRCCCGGPGTTSCERSRHAFTITTWTLRMDDMTTWDKVGVVDSDELWSLPGYSDGEMSRVRPTDPIVSLEDPDVLFLMVHQMKRHSEDGDADHETRLIELDTKRMELQSVFCYDHDLIHCPEFIPCAITQYFDASSRSRPPPSAKRHEQAPTTMMEKRIELSLPDNTAMASPEEMLATLQEIGGLARDDMLKTYSVLACDGGQFKFRSLLALPKDMRKDFSLLLIESRL